MTVGDRDSVFSEILSFALFEAGLNYNETTPNPKTQNTKSIAKLILQMGVSGRGTINNN